MRRKVLLRAGWKNIFCISDSEKVSLAGEVSETHYCKSGMEVYFSLVL